MPISFVPGDLIFFRAYDALSLGISYRTCTWRQLLLSLCNGGFLPSHVGVCADYETEVDHKTGAPPRARTLLFESTTLCPQPCFISGKQVSGVQAHLPEQRIAAYPGRAWRLRLRRPLDSEQSRGLSDFLISQIGMPYNYRRAVALAGFFWGRFAHSLDPLPETWFCDELCIEALKTVNRVGVDNDPEDFSPATFAHLVLHSGECWPLSQVGSKSFRVK